MRMFSALLPPREAIEHLAAAVGQAEPVIAAVPIPGGRFRFTPVEQWHVTLGFYPDVEPDERAEKLLRRTRKLSAEAPTLRFVSAGMFTGVLWVGVQPLNGDHRGALRRLASAAGADLRRYTAHVTVGRWSRGNPSRAAITAPLRDYRGPWWTPAEMTLFASEQGAAGPVYTPMHRIPLPPVSARNADVPPANR